MPPASHIHDARRHDRSCDSSGCPNALSWASANVATNSLRRSGVEKMGNTPDVENVRRTHHAPARRHAVDALDVSATLRLEEQRHGGTNLLRQSADQGGDHRGSNRAAVSA